MFKYILKRLLMLIPIIIGISFLIYFVMSLSPGDPARIILGEYATQEDVDALREEMGLNDSLIVQYIQENTPENAIVFLTGVGKSYPLLRSHNVLNNLHQSYLRAPVVMFFPGTYNEQELILFNEIKDDNYYRAFRLVK